MKGRVIFIIVALLIPAALFALGPITIGVSVPSFHDPYYAAMKAGVEETAARLDVEVIFIESGWSSYDQQRGLKRLVTQKVSAILFSPIDKDFCISAIESAAAAGIPVATVVSKANSEKVLVHVGLDGVEAGRIAAQHVIDKVGNRGGVIKLEASPVKWTEMKSFEDAIGQSSVKLLASRTSTGFRRDAKSVMAELITAYPDFNAVYCAYGDMIMGVMDAMSAAGIDPSKKVLIAEVAGNPQEFIGNSTFLAAIDNLQAEQASRAITALVEYLRNGKQPEKEIYITPKLIAADG